MKDREWNSKESRNILEKTKQILAELKQTSSNGSHQRKNPKSSMSDRFTMIKEGVKQTIKGSQQVIVGSKEIALGVAKIRLALGSKQNLPLAYITQIRHYRPQTKKDYMVISGLIASVAGIGYIASRLLLKNKRIM